MGRRGEELGDAFGEAAVSVIIGGLEAAAWARAAVSWEMVGLVAVSALVVGWAGAHVWRFWQEHRRGRK